MKKILSLSILPLLFLIGIFGYYYSDYQSRKIEIEKVSHYLDIKKQIQATIDGLKEKDEKIALLGVNNGEKKSALMQEIEQVHTIKANLEKELKITSQDTIPLFGEKGKKYLLIISLLFGAYILGISYYVSKNEKSDGQKSI